MKTNKFSKLINQLIIELTNLFFLLLVLEREKNPKRENQREGGKETMDASARHHL